MKDTTKGFLWGGAVVLGILAGIWWGARKLTWLVKPATWSKKVLGA